MLCPFNPRSPGGCRFPGVGWPSPPTNSDMKNEENIAPLLPAPFISLAALPPEHPEIPPGTGAALPRAGTEPALLPTPAAPCPTCAMAWHTSCVDLRSWLGVLGVPGSAPCPVQGVGESHPLAHGGSRGTVGTPQGWGRSTWGCTAGRTGAVGEGRD